MSRPKSKDSPWNLYKRRNRQANMDDKKQVLIHEDDNYFNVVLPKSDKVIKRGSLSNDLIKGALMSDFMSGDKP